MLGQSVVTALVLTKGAEALTASQQRDRLNPKIGGANKRLYETVRDAREWRNPYLVIVPHGIDVISQSLPSGRTTVVPAELARTLIDLPVEAWPYGRLVVASDIGIRVADTNGRSDPAEEESIKRNHQAAALSEQLDAATSATYSQRIIRNTH